MFLSCSVFTQTTETMSYIVIKQMQVGKIDIF